MRRDTENITHHHLDIILHKYPVSRPPGSPDIICLLLIYDQTRCKRTGSKVASWHDVVPIIFGIFVFY